MTAGMSNVASIAIPAMTAATGRLDVPARSGANASSPGPAPSADRAVLGRFRAASGLVRVEQVETTLVYDPSAPFAASNGLVAAPNVDLSQEAKGPFSGYGLAFNSPIMHLYTQTEKSIVNLLA